MLELLLTFSDYHPYTKRRPSEPGPAEAVEERKDNVALWWMKADVSCVDTSRVI